MQKSKLTIFHLILIGFVFLIVSFITIKGNLSSMDEIWTYQFARRILYKQVPYRDFFMIVSPLKAQIDSILLKLFSDQLFVLRWFTLFIASIYGFLLFQISTKFGLSRINSLFTVVLFCFSFTFFPVNNYNWFSLLIIALLLFLLTSIQNGRNGFLAGFLIAMLLISKQNIGIYTMIGISYYFWMTRYKYYLCSLAGFCVGFIPEIVYFQTQGALKDFLQIFYINWIPFFEEYFYIKTYVLFGSFCIAFFLFFLQYFLIKKTKKIQGKENLILLIVINLIVLGYSFPIFDMVHLSFLFPYIFLLIAISWNFDCKAGIHFVVFLIFIQGFNWYFSIQNSSLTSIPHFKNIQIDREFASSIIAISNFQKEQIALGNHPYEIDYRNVLFDVVMDQFGHKFDCMLKGNFGRNGENEIISKIAKDPKAIIIFHKIYSNNKQQSMITNYVKRNLFFKEMIGNGFLIYSHNK